MQAKRGKFERMTAHVPDTQSMDYPRGPKMGKTIQIRKLFLHISGLPFNHQD